jgi:hypothetical protein
LFYRTLDGALMSVATQTQNGFAAGPPMQILSWPYYRGTTGRQYDVSRDGQRFLMLKDTGGKIVVVANWFEELKRRVPTP